MTLYSAYTHALICLSFHVSSLLGVEFTFRSSNIYSFKCLLLRYLNPQIDLKFKRSDIVSHIILTRTLSLPDYIPRCIFVLSSLSNISICYQLSVLLIVLNESIQSRYASCKYHDLRFIPLGNERSAQCIGRTEIA